MLFKEMESCAHKSDYGNLIIWRYDLYLIITAAGSTLCWHHLASIDGSRVVVIPVLEYLESIIVNVIVLEYIYIIRFLQNRTTWISTICQTLRSARETVPKSA